VRVRVRVRGEGERVQRVRGRARVAGGAYMESASCAIHAHVPWRCMNHVRAVAKAAARERS
jgi:hypothetical protein